MNILSTFFLSIFFLLPQNDPQTKKIKVELVPYGEVYPFNIPFDTICPSGIFLRNLVNRDTADHNLYLSYGDKTKRKIYTVEDGLETPLCARPLFAYATTKTIAMLSDCMHSKAILLLHPTENFVKVEHYTPLYINMIDSLLLLQDHEAGKDKFLLSDLDNRSDKRQSVYLAPIFEDVINPVQKAFSCPVISDCFDDIHYWAGNLYVTFFTRTIKEEKPEPLTKTIKVKWK